MYKFKTSFKITLKIYKHRCNCLCRDIDSSRSSADSGIDDDVMETSQTTENSKTSPAIEDSTTSLAAGDSTTSQADVSTSPNAEDSKTSPAAENTSLTAGVTSPDTVEAVYAEPIPVQVNYQ